MSIFKLNMKKASRDFGSVAKMSKAFQMKQPTLEHIIYKKKSYSFRSDAVREAVNDLISKGYLLYADEVGDMGRQESINGEVSSRSKINEGGVE